MATIMDMVHESLDPVSTGNALYEVMLDWYSIASEEMSGMASRSRVKKLESKRHQLEIVLGRFLNRDMIEVREHLCRHFKVTVTLR